MIYDTTNQRSKGTLQALKTSLSNKIDDMRHELDERCTKANLLHSKLNKTKECNAQNLIKLKEKWKRRLDDQCLEHDEVSFTARLYYCIIETIVATFTTT